MQVLKLAKDLHEGDTLRVSGRWREVRSILYDFAGGKMVVQPEFEKPITVCNFNSVFLCLER